MGATTAGKRKMSYYDRYYRRWLKRGSPAGVDPAEDEASEDVSDVEEFKILEEEL
jgi:hypothetical protein